MTTKKIMKIKRNIRRSALFILFTGIFCIISACSSKETALLKEDELVWESGDAADGQNVVNEQNAVDGETAPGGQNVANGQNAADGETAAGGQNVVNGQTAADGETAGGQTAAEGQAEQSGLFIHICGEVTEPGVYELPAGSRIYEAVEMAGGFTPEASKSYVNLAQTLRDGDKIEIPAEGEEPSVPAGQGEAAAESMADDLVDINTASRQELCTIPGVGESRADSIISYREQNGGFSRIEDIMKVEGIKEGMFAKMKDKICVRGVR